MSVNEMADKSDSLSLESIQEIIDSSSSNLSYLLLPLHQFLSLELSNIVDPHRPSQQFQSLTKNIPLSVKRTIQTQILNGVTNSLLQRESVVRGNHLTSFASKIPMPHIHDNTLNDNLLTEEELSAEIDNALNFLESFSSDTPIIQEEEEE